MDQLNTYFAHEAKHISGGSDAFTSSQLLEAIVKRWQESGGPTTLAAGAVADGEFLKRVGSSIVGATPSGTPDYSCRIYNSANQSITNGAFVPATFDTEMYDTDTMHSTSSNTSRITFTHGGKYRYGSSFNFDSNAVGARYIETLLGGTTRIGITNVVAAPSNATCLFYVSEYVFSAGDYIEFNVLQNSGGNLNILKETNASSMAWASLLSL